MNYLDWEYFHQNHHSLLQFPSNHPSYSNTTIDLAMVVHQESSVEQESNIAKRNTGTHYIGWAGYVVVRVFRYPQ